MNTDNRRAQIVVNGKTYGYAVDAQGKLRAGFTVEIRSEDNPAKTPYLKTGSPVYSKVLAAIKASQAAA